MTSVKTSFWDYRTAGKIRPQNLHIEVIADYGGGYTTDHAFDEVRNHFFRFDKERKIRVVTEHPVYAFSTFNRISHFVLNTFRVPNLKSKIGDLCLVVGSSGGKKGTYLEIVRLQNRASDDFKIEGPRDDLGKIKIEPIRT